MKETICPLCGEKISIGDETAYRQHVLCPYCGGKFSYLVDSAEFSAERLAYAIAECRKNNDDNRYYNLAPAGARLYIGMIFYGTVFRDELNKKLYMEAMEQVESQLKRQDWQYLIENESDSELIAHFRDRMDVLSSEQPASPADSRVEMVDRAREAEAERETRAWKQRLASRLVTTACFLAVVIVGYVLIDKILHVVDDPKPSAHTEETANPQVPDIPEPVSQPTPPPEEKPSPKSEVAVPSPAVDATPVHTVSEPAKPTEQAPSVPEKQIVDDGYDKAVKAFGDTELLFWEDLKARERPCGYIGTWYCAIPRENVGFDMYKVECSESSNVVWLLAREKTPKRTKESEFDGHVRDRGAVFADGHVAVLRGYGRMDPDELAIPKKDETVSVGEDYFAKAYPCLNKLKVNVSSVMFRIELTRSSKTMVVQDVGADDEIGREPFAKVAHAFVLEKKRSEIDGKDAHIKKPKVTVVLCDDMVGGTGVNGVKKIPRRFKYENVTESDMACIRWRNQTGNKCYCTGCKLRDRVMKEREKWNQLHDMAVAQAAAMEEYNVKVQQKIEQLRQAVKVSQGEVESFLNGARATFRRLPNKVSPQKKID